MNRQRRNAGYSLVEAVVATALLMTMILVLISLAQTGSDGQEYARRVNRATEVSHDVLDRIRTEMVSCVRLFGADAEGAENLALLDLSAAPAPFAGLRLPTTSAGQSIRPDTVGAEITGNTLFFARLAWTDRFVCTSGRAYMVDVYRWMYYYLAAHEAGPQPDVPFGVDLVRFESEPLIDAASIDRISDPDDLAEVLLHLHDGTPDASGVAHAPCELVWLRGALPSLAGTLRMIDDSDGSLSDSPIGSRPDPWSVLPSTPVVAGLLGDRHHSIASNFTEASRGVGRYAIVDPTGDGFPHGFEVQMVGPSSARQTLLHLVVTSTYRRGHYAFSDVQQVIDTRDI